MRSILAGLRQLVLPWGAGPGTPRVVLGPDIPAELSAYYNGGSYNFPVIFAIIWYYDAVSYYYDVGLDSDGAGSLPHGTGWVVAGTVFEEKLDVIFDTSPFARLVNFGGVTSQGTSPLTAIFGDISAGETGAFDVSNHVELGGNMDLLVSGVSQGRGFRRIATSTSDSAAIGAEAVSLTLSNVAFRDGRAYRGRFGHRITTSLGTNTAQWSIRKDNAAGTQYMQGGAFGPSGTAQPINAQGEFYLRRNGGSGDVTITIVLTWVASAGTMVHKGSAVSPRYLILEEVGSYADYTIANFV